MKLIILLASHIECKKRLQFFVKMLSMINEQIDYHEEIDLRVSLSHEPSFSRDEITFPVETISKNKYKFYYQDSKLSQFEHYQFLVHSLEKLDDNDTWILFSDDDDEWGENRLAAYHYMINSIPIDELNFTSCICYTNDSNTTKNASTYIGSYVDYCIKLKYLRIFIDNCTFEQLQNKFCDCYFVKFMCTYGKGILKKGFCTADDILYKWIPRRRHEFDEKLSLKESLSNNLDLYMAQYSKPTAKDWVQFCDVYTNGKISEGLVPIEIKRFIVQIYLNVYDKHIFHTKNLPIYSD